MTLAVAAPLGRPEQSQFGQPRPMVTRDQVLTRYRRLRAISKEHHNAAFQFLSPGAVMQHLRRLGLAHRGRLVLASDSEATLASDLALYTAPPGRSRALDRYARNVPQPAGSDEALMLDAMRNARFAVLVMRRRHPAEGLVYTDMFREEDIWLVDEGHETWFEEGLMLTARYCTPGPFSMTAGVGIPADIDFLEEALDAVPHLMRKPKRQAIDDPRFAEAIYRAAIREGIMGQISFQDPPAADYAA
jgi:hypothetical protein